MMNPYKDAPLVFLKINIGNNTRIQTKKVISEIHINQGNKAELNHTPPSIKKNAINTVPIRIAKLIKQDPKFFIFSPILEQTKSYFTKYLSKQLSFVLSRASATESAT